MACRMIISSCALVGLDSKRGGGRRARFCPSSTGSSHDGFPGSLLLLLRPPPVAVLSPALAPISSRPRFVVPPPPPPAAAGPGGAAVLGWAGVMVGRVQTTRWSGCRELDGRCCCSGHAGAATGWLPRSVWGSWGVGGGRERVMCYSLNTRGQQGVDMDVHTAGRRGRAEPCGRSNCFETCWDATGTRTAFLQRRGLAIGPGAFWWRVVVLLHTMLFSTLSRCSRCVVV